MYIKLDEDIIKEIEEVTGTDYELEGNFMPEDSVYCLVEDLLYEIHHLKEEIEDIHQDIKDNYKQIPYSDQIGVCDYDL